MLGVSHMPYAEDFAHFEQKKQYMIKMKLKQRKYNETQISHGQQFLR